MMQKKSCPDIEQLPCTEAKVLVQTVLPFSGAGLRLHMCRPMERQLSILGRQYR